MGILAGWAPYVLPRFPNVYVGITTGLCGCTTTFSAWNAEAAETLAAGAAARAALCLVVGLAAALASLRFGFGIGAPQRHRSTQSPPAPCSRLPAPSAHPPASSPPWPGAALVPARVRAAAATPAAPAAPAAGAGARSHSLRSSKVEVRRSPGRCGSVRDAGLSPQRCDAPPPATAGPHICVPASHLCPGVAICPGIAPLTRQVDVEELDLDEVIHELDDRSSEAGARAKQPLGEGVPSRRSLVGKGEPPPSLAQRALSRAASMARPVPQLQRTETKYHVYNTYKLPCSAATLLLLLAVVCVAVRAAAAAVDTAADADAATASLTLYTALLLSPPCAVLRYASHRHHPTAALCHR